MSYSLQVCDEVEMLCRDFMWHSTTDL